MRFPAAVRYYPLTLGGTLLLIACGALLARGLGTGNPYELVLSLLGLAGLLLLAAGGRLKAWRLSRLPFEWDSSRPAAAGEPRSEQRLLSGEFRTGAFHRLHFRVSGWLTVGRGARMFVAGEASAAAGREITARLYFPLCGEFRAAARLSVKDIFGLTRSGLNGPNDRRLLVVLPAPFFRPMDVSVEAVGGFEDKSQRKSTDEERYYMREYIPGDRFRDINWKVSSRLAQLVTRVSPYTQEKTKVVPVLFRPFRPPGPESVESLVHLNVIKSWLIAFLRQVKQEHPEYQFMIWTGEGREHLESEQDIERFAWSLSTRFYLTDPLEAPAESAWEEVYVFTTAFDRTLSTALAVLPPSAPRVFRTRPAGRKEDGWRYSLFESLDALALPGPWVLRRDRRGRDERLSSTPGRVEELALDVEVLPS